MMPGVCEVSLLLLLYYVMDNLYIVINKYVNNIFKYYIHVYDAL